MGEYSLGLNIEHEIGEKVTPIQSYSTLLLSFNVGDKCKVPILLNYLDEMKKYDFLIKDNYMKNVITAYFQNYGKKLYILSQPLNKNIIKNSGKYLEFLEQNCDIFTDIETILAIDIFQQNFTDFENQEIQNTISEYCNLSYRISISDLPKENAKNYYKSLYNTVVFYPWIKNDSNYIPPSIYAAALCNSLASTDGISESIANKKLDFINDTVIDTDDDLVSELTSLNIIPISFSRTQGYKIWGIKTLNFIDKDLEYFNVLRVIRYIERSFIKIGREYIFEPNTPQLKNIILRRIDVFLTELWENGVLAGDTEDNAFLIDYLAPNSSKENEIIIEVGVYIERLIEFISIKLIRTTSEDNKQASIEVIS